MAETKRYQITPEQSEILKSKLGPDVIWQEIGTRTAARVNVQRVDLALSYDPPCLDVTVLKKPWYATESMVWQKLDDYIYRQLEPKIQELEGAKL